MGEIWAVMPFEYFPESGSLPGFRFGSGLFGDHGDFSLDF
jgi:hypothetical protein